MAIVYQLDFTKEPETCRLEAIIEYNFQRQEKVRKGTYAKITELNRKYDELRHEFEQLKQAMCKE